MGRPYGTPQPASFGTKLRTQRDARWAAEIARSAPKQETIHQFCQRTRWAYETARKAAAASGHVFPRAPAVVQGIEWTPAQIAQLRRLWARGTPTVEIAKKIGGVTKNAVIGKAHRIGLPAHKSAPRRNWRAILRTAKRIGKTPHDVAREQDCALGNVYTAEAAHGIRLLRATVGRAA